MSEPLAVIADVHGNSCALRAVLADIRSQGITRVLALGDHFSGPLAARECADLLVDSDILCLRGNHDRILSEQMPERMEHSDRVAFDQLAPDHLDWLRTLPDVLRLEGIFACHGTPESDTTYWLDRLGPSGETQLRPLPETLALAEGIDEALILCAHTHIPRRVDLPDGRAILNPGSVGCPGFDDTHPQYHVIEAGTHAACYATARPTLHGWATSHHHVPYDTARMVALARQHGRRTWADALGTGWLRGL